MKRAPQYYEFGPFRLDAAQRLLLREGQPVQLPPKALDVLLVLVENRGQVLSRDELMRRVWPETFVEEGNLGQNIFLIRKVLGSGEDGKDYIRTLPKRGYCFSPEVNELRERNSPLIVTEHRVSGVLIEEETSLTQTGANPSASAFTASGRTQHSRLSRKSAAWLLAAGLVFAGAVATYLTTLHIKKEMRQMLLRSGIGGQPASRAFQTFEVRKLTSTGASIEAAISPNGKYVAHVVDELGSQSLWTRQTATPNDLEIMPPADVRYLGLTFSHDSDWIYFVRDNDLFLIAALGGAPRKLLSGLSSPITLSPDGKQLAFVRTGNDNLSSLIVFDLDSENERVIASRQAPSYYRSPAWSPNNKTIACSAGTRSGPSLMSLVEVDLETGRERPLTDRQWSSAGRVTWLEDGSGLLMAAGEPAKHSQIWLISHPHGEVRAVTSTLVNHRGVSLTRDSSVLLTTAHEQSTNIWVASIDDTNPLKPITAGTGADDDPRWLPDGRLVFASEAAGDRNLWVSNADGSSRRQLTFGAYRDASPVVSPDGRYVVFSSSRGGSRSLWRVGIDGDGLKRLTNGVEDSSPSFSPDGKWIVFSRYAERWETLWKVSAEGGDAVQLTDKLSKYPVVSPDGKFIACYYWDHQEGSSVQIAIVAFGGGKPVKAFETKALTILSPIEYRWTPDGRAITYVATQKGASNIWRQDVAGGPPRQITSFKSERILSFDWSPDGKQLVFSRGRRSSDVVLMTDSK
jgi:Tol biopolymer transport system component/DNA-binding winged helix-turn-helix (wHTH) protein